MFLTAYYFGCGDRVGHYVFAPGMNSAPREADQFNRFDGKLAPELPRRPGSSLRVEDEQFVVKAWRIGPLAHGEWSAISWWDRTVDKRAASNSILWAPGVVVTLGGMQHLLEQHFPAVVKRMPRLLYLPKWHAYASPPA